MKNQRILKIIKSVKLTLMAHPENEPNSEFEDQIKSLEELEKLVKTEISGNTGNCKHEI
jgi:hypothetical protein